MLISARISFVHKGHLGGKSEGVLGFTNRGCEGMCESGPELRKGKGWKKHQTKFVAMTTGIGVGY